MFNVQSVLLAIPIYAFMVAVPVVFVILGSWIFVLERKIKRNGSDKKTSYTGKSATVLLLLGIIIPLVFLTVETGMFLYSIRLCPGLLTDEQIAGRILSIFLYAMLISADFLLARSVSAKRRIIKKQN